MLADGTNALVGGINVAGKYEGRPFERAWLDFAVKITGPVCKDVMRICEDAWGRRKKKFFKRELHPIVKTIAQPEAVKVRLLQNDWIRRYIEISRFYRQQIKYAEKSIVIAASYFLPGTRMRYLLRKASERGVKITFILGGRSDVGFMKQATNFLYPFLFRNKIDIFEWQPSVLHAKLMIVDERLVTVGSYNLNALSDYGSLELNVCVDDIDFALSASQTLLKLADEGCRKVEADAFIKQHYWWNQLINWTSYQVLRLVLKLVFFFMRK